MLEENKLDRRAALLAVAGIGALATLQGCRGEEGDEDMPLLSDAMNLPRISLTFAHWSDDVPVARMTPPGTSVEPWDTIGIFAASAAGTADFHTDWSWPLMRMPSG